MTFQLASEKTLTLGQVRVHSLNVVARNHWPSKQFLGFISKGV